MRLMMVLTTPCRLYLPPRMKTYVPRRHRQRMSFRAGSTSLHLLPVHHTAHHYLLPFHPRRHYLTRHLIRSSHLVTAVIPIRRQRREWIVHPDEKRSDQSRHYLRLEWGMGRHEGGTEMDGEDSVIRVRSRVWQKESSLYPSVHGPYRQTDHRCR